MSTDDVLLGLGLVIVLAVGSQLLAGRLRLPAIVVLLPVGFLAGIATDDVHPDALLGALYQPFVSLAVGLILFEAGLRLSVREVARDLRQTVGLLVTVGVLVTWAGIWGATALLFDDLGDLVPLLIGAVLVVSGPDRRSAAAVVRPPGAQGALAADVGGGARRSGGRPARRHRLPRRAFRRLERAAVAPWRDAAQCRGRRRGRRGGRRDPVAPAAGHAAQRSTAGRPGGAHDGRRRPRRRRPHPRGRGLRRHDADGRGPGQPAQDRRLADARVPRHTGADADRRPVRAHLRIGVAVGRPGGAARRAAARRGDGARDPPARGRAGDLALWSESPRACVRRLDGSARDRGRGHRLGLRARARAGPRAGRRAHPADRLRGDLRHRGALRPDCGAGRAAARGGRGDGSGSCSSSAARRGRARSRHR